MTMKNFARPIALAAVLGTLALPVSAQWGPEEEKNCFLKGGQKGTITLSGQINDAQGDSSKLEQYEEIPEGVLVPCAAYSWSNEKYFFDAKAIDIGYDDQFLGGVFGKKGGFKLGLSWNENPNWQSNTARTPYTETSPGVFRASDSMRLALQNVYVPWVPPTASNPVGTGTAPANPTVPGFYAVEDYVNLGLPTFDLRYVRKTGRAGFEVPVGESLVLNASYARETREGNKNTTFYGGPDYEVATPIDFVTDNFRFGGDFAKGRFFLGASVDFSQFNERGALRRDRQPRAAGDVQPDERPRDLQRRRILPPRDVPGQRGLAGRLHRRLHAARAAQDHGVALHRQHEHGHGAAEHLDQPQPADERHRAQPAVHGRPALRQRPGRVRHVHGPAEVHRRPGQLARLHRVLAQVRARRQDRGLPLHEHGPRRRGRLLQRRGFTREHEGWSIESLRGEVHVTPVTGLRLGASYGQDKRKYDIREYADVTDDVFTLTGDFTNRLFSLRLKYDVLDRKPGDSNEEAIPPTWDGATQTDITERNRHMFSGFLTVTPTEKLAITLNGAKTTNEFAESVTGLTDQSFDMFGIDLSYAANDKVSFFVGYVYEDYFFDMSAAYIPRGLNPPFDPANQWANQTDDKVDTFRAGFDWVLVPDKWTLNATFDYTKPRSESVYDFALPGTPIGGLNEANGIFPANVPPIPGFPVTTFDSFPTVLKKFTMAKIRLAYNITKNFTASAMYWKQKYDNDDWQTELTQPYMGRVDPGANRWFFLGANIPSYDANIFRASVTYTF